MILKFILQLSSVFLLSFVLTLNAFAFVSEVIPGEAGQGGLFFVKFCQEKALSPEIKFRNKKFKMYPDKDGCFLSLIPVDVETEPGDYRIAINTADTSFSLKVKVNSIDFPTKHITLPEKKVSLSPQDRKRVEKE